MSTPEGQMGPGLHSPPDERLTHPVLLHDNPAQEVAGGPGSGSALSGLQGSEDCPGEREMEGSVHTTCA